MRLAAAVLSLICLAIPLEAIAKPRPKIAVAPLKGDGGNKVADAVVAALDGKDFVVVGPKEVGREMTRLGLPDELDGKATRKLGAQLGVVVVIDGAVVKSRSKSTLHLEVHRHGKPDAGFTIEFKTTSSPAFRRGVHDEVARKLERADEPDASDASDDEEAAKPAKPERPEKPRPADEPARRAPERREAIATRKRADDDNAPAVRTRKSRRNRDDDAAPLVLARVAAGASVAQRRLVFDTRAGFAQVPPRVLTTAGAGRVDGEIYPFALANPTSALAPLGLAGSYDKTFGLSIKIPNQSVRAPIDQSHYAIGARYRFTVGEASSLALGLDYVRRHYIADRSSLMAAVLDAPDVDYTAVAPTAAARVPVTSSIAIIAGVDGLLMLQAGPIQNTSSYGPAKVYGLEAIGGVEIAIAPRLGLRVAAEYSQISFSFGAKGVMASNRDNDATTQDVNGATDRSIGVAATLGLVY